MILPPLVFPAVRVRQWQNGHFLKCLYRGESLYSLRPCCQCIIIIEIVEWTATQRSLWSSWKVRWPGCLSSALATRFSPLKFVQGILKGEVSLYHWPPVWLFWNQLYDYWQFLFLFCKQTDPNQSNRRSMVQWFFPLLVFPGLSMAQAVPIARDSESCSL